MNDLVVGYILIGLAGAVAFPWSWAAGKIGAAFAKIGGWLPGPTPPTPAPAADPIAAYRLLKSLCVGNQPALDGLKVVWLHLEPQEVPK